MLSAFVAVAEHRNFTKASALLGVSPSTLSQSIRSFEERSGVRLLNRTSRSVALTEVGEQLLVHAQPGLDGIDKAIDAVNSFRDKPIGTHGNHNFLDALACPNVGIGPADDDIAVSIVDVHFKFYFRKFGQELRQQRTDSCNGRQPLAMLSRSVFSINSA